MPFREKAKSLFRSRNKEQQSQQSSLSKSSTIDSSSTTATSRWPSNVYRPGEPMPRPKYRAVPKKEHKEKLEAFTFSDAWRRSSFQSQYSPMGTRAPSRRNSATTRQNSTFSLTPGGNGGQKKTGGSSTSRTNSITSADTDGSNVATRPRESAMFLAARPTTLPTEPEQLGGDDDVANVGKSVAPDSTTYRIPRNPLSRKRTAEPPTNSTAAAAAASTATKPGPVGQNMSTAHDHQPFTEQDLTLALHRSHLTVPTH